MALVHEIQQQVFTNIIKIYSRKIWCTENC